MRPCLVSLLVLAAGCGPGSPLAGTWRYTLEAKMQAATGDVTKRVTFDVELAPTAAADLITWRVGGGCNVGLPVTDKVALLGAAPPLCGLSGGAKIVVYDQLGAMVKMDDQLAVRAARFEVLTDGKLGTSFDMKLFTDLKDARVGPVITLTTTAATHGTKLR